MRISETAEGILVTPTEDDHFLYEDEKIEFLLALALFRHSGYRTQVAGEWGALAREYFPDRGGWNAEETKH